MSAPVRYDACHDLGDGLAVYLIRYASGWSYILLHGWSLLAMGNRYTSADAALSAARQIARDRIA